MERGEQGVGEENNIPEELLWLTSTENLPMARKGGKEREQGSTDFYAEQGCHSYLSRFISQYNVGNIGYGKLAKQ